MEALYITIIVLISLFCDFMLWQHFSACFEMQFKLTNQIPPMIFIQGHAMYYLNCSKNMCRYFLMARK